MQQSLVAGMLAVFAKFEREILRERVKAGIAQARAKGVVLGRPKSAANKIAEVRRLYRKEKLTKSEIARRLGIGRTSVRRLFRKCLKCPQDQMAHFRANRCRTPIQVFRAGA
jgi:DNA invertase Pin-like site-specific DNA recombinase